MLERSADGDHNSELNNKIVQVCTYCYDEPLQGSMAQLGSVEKNEDSLSFSLFKNINHGVGGSSTGCAELLTLHCWVFGIKI